jgi:hypothetical protein
MSKKPNKKESKNKKKTKLSKLIGAITATSFVAINHPS